MIYNKIADKTDLLEDEVNTIWKDMKVFTKRCIDLTGIVKVIHEGDSYDSSWESQRGWIKYWEYCRSIAFSQPKFGQMCYDVGGCRSLFGHYLTSHYGIEMTISTTDEDDFKHCLMMSEKLENNVTPLFEDISETEAADNAYDHIYCMSVWEHIPRKKQSEALLQMKRILKPGGVLSLTFDYGKGCPDNPILSPEEVQTRIIDIIGLEPIGNKEFSLESQFPYFNLDYTFGAIYFRK